MQWMKMSSMLCLMRRNLRIENGDDDERRGTKGMLSDQIIQL